MLFQMNLLHKAHVSLNMSELQGKKNKNKKKATKQKTKRNMMEMGKWETGNPATIGGGCSKYCSEELLYFSP